MHIPKYFFIFSPTYEQHRGAYQAAAAAMKAATGDVSSITKAKIAPMSARDLPLDMKEDLLAVLAEDAPDLRRSNSLQTTQKFEL